MPTNPIKGSWLQHWQYGLPSAAEATFDDLLNTALTYGFRGVLVKALDGRDWMANIPSQLAHPDALGSVAQAVAQQRDAARRGLGYGVWVNPLWGNDPYLLAQAEDYAALGQALGSLAWDTEPYDGFWGANRPPASVVLTMERFRSLAPDCWNIWQPDPRPARLAELGAVWGQYMNTFAGQDYWPSFDTTGIEQLDATHRVILRAKQDGTLHSDADWCPTLPGSTEPLAITRAAVWAEGVGCPGAIFWRLGAMNAEQLSAAAPGPWKPENPPGDPCLALRTDLAQKTARISAALAYVDGPAAFSRAHLAGLLDGSLPF